MKPLKWLAGLIIFVVCLPCTFSGSPVGIWVTVDEKTGDKRALVELSLRGDTLFGKIVHVYPQPGDTGICLKCPGRFKDKSIEGKYDEMGLLDFSNEYFEDAISTASNELN